MKRVILGTFVILVGCFAVYYIVVLKTNDEPIPNELHTIHSNSPTSAELFVKKYLMTDHGTIRTNFESQREGKIELSESIGLWLQYLVAKEDPDEFERAFKSMKNHFQLENKLIAWKVEDNKKADTNALIDDLRIIEALFTMGEKMGNDNYIVEAIAMSQAVLKYNRNASFFVDFYDVNYRYANEELTVSYMNYDAVFYMEKYGVIKPKLGNEIYTFMEELPIKNGFYPQTYDVIKKTYAFNEEINVIDQLYITLHLERAGIQTDEFYKWITTEFYEKHHLYGRYTADTKKNTVTYESAAVYALAVMYGLARGDQEFAIDVYTQLMTMQVQDETSAYNGGFIDEQTMSTHSFDHLLSLLAERNLASENIIP